MERFANMFNERAIFWPYHFLSQIRESIFKTLLWCMLFFTSLLDFLLNVSVKTVFNAPPTILTCLTLLLMKFILYMCVKCVCAFWHRQNVSGQNHSSILILDFLLIIFVNNNNRNYAIVITILSMQSRIWHFCKNL